MDAGNGIVQLLLDRQMNPAEGALFVHDARKLTNASGVQRGSQLSFGWDPSYQTLTLHAVSVLRGGQRINALRRSGVRVLERETEMDWHLYDGSLSAVLLLEDVRPGDVVEYAYTVGGTNPVLGGRYFDGLGMRGSAPCAHLRYRLLWPQGRALFTRAHGEVPEPVISRRGPVTEYVWEATNVPALLSDADLPAWFDPYPWVQLSEWASWKDVALWAVPLYVSKDPGEAVRAEARRIAATAGTARERIVAALRFVQEEVRYLGLEMGVGSYRPNPPRDVLARRFGDCKDKTLLLLALLEALGVEARPALVHSERLQSLDLWHPSPMAFNHAIVRVRLDGKELWLDPTRTRQGGTLEEVWLPAFRRALVVDPSTEGLATIPDHATPSPLTRVVETWTVPDFNAPAALLVTTTRRGPSADAARERFAAASRDALERGALEYYTERYPEISTAARLEIDDDLNANVLKTSESYAVKGLFASTDEGARLVASFFPQEIRDVLPDPGSRRRTMPLGLAFPQHLVHETVIHLPVDWSMPLHDEAIETSSFRFVSHARSSGREVRFRYEWMTLADAVAVADAGPTLTKISMILAGLGWELTHDPAAAARASAPLGSDLNVPVIGAALVLLLVCAGIALRLARWRPAEPPGRSEDADDPLDGLGGWLIVVGLGCVIRPFTILVVSATNDAVFRSSSWLTLTSPNGAAYHPVWAPLLLGELFANIVLFVLSVLLVVLFFRRRRAFPPLAIAFMAIAVAVTFADAAAVRLLPEASGSVSREVATQAGRAALQAATWIPYLLLSRRVRATFRR